MLPAWLAFQPLARRPCWPCASRAQHAPSCWPACLQALFNVSLPPGGKLPAGYKAVQSQTTIAGLKDEVVIMHSLMKPKKITFLGRCAAVCGFVVTLGFVSGSLHAWCAREGKGEARCIGAFQQQAWHGVSSC